MNKFTKLALAGLFLTSSAFLLSSCKDEQTAKAPAVKEEKLVTLADGTVLAAKQEVTFNLGGFPATLDPNLSTDHNSSTIIATIFETLFREGKTGALIPAAAESYSVSEDGLTWTIKLAKGNTWSDGKPVRAQDFVYSWRRLADPATGSGYQDYLANGFVKNIEAVVKGEKKPEELGVEATDDNTLVVHLSSPCPWLPSILSYPVLSPVRQDVIEKYGAQAFTVDHIVGNGPYTLKTYNVNDIITVEKRPSYHHASDVIITKGNFVFLSDVNTSYIKYTAGDLDTTNIPPNLAPQVAKERPNEIRKAVIPSVSYIDFNFRSPVLQDKRIREAITLLTDSKLITDQIYKKGQTTTIFAPTFVADAQLATEAAYLDQPMEERIARAVALVKEVGYSSEHPLELRFLIGQSPLEKRQFVAQESLFKKATNGAVILKPEIVEWKVFLDKMFSGDFDLANDGWGADYKQASTFYNVFKCGAAINNSHYCNPEYDKYVDLASRTAEDHQRAEYYAKANKVLQDDWGTIVLRWPVRSVLKNPALEGYNPENSFIFLNDLYLVAHPKEDSKK